MYRTCQQIRTEIKNKKPPLKKCVGTWIDGLNRIVECIDENHYKDDNPESDSLDSSDPDQLVKIENINFLVKDIIKTLELLEKNKIAVHKRNKSMLYNLSKIITRHLFVGDLELVESDLIKLLDFINWDCSLLFQHAEDWASSEEDAGYDIVTMIKLADAHKRVLTGFTKYNVIYALLMAVYHCNNERAEELIIKKKIRLTKSLAEDNDAMISDMIEYFKDKEYDILPKKSSDSD
jgi:hypothetical protein